MTRKTYRHRQLEVEAMQYLLSLRPAIIAWCGDAIQHTAIDDDGSEYDLRNLRITTDEGTLMVELGTWIVKGVLGEFYPVSADLFPLLYESGDGIALTSARHPPAFDADAEVPGIHTELDLLTGAVRAISANEEKLTDVVTRHFMQELGQCDGACTWHVVFGWAPEAGCPVHDADG